MGSVNRRSPSCFSAGMFLCARLLSMLSTCSGFHPCFKLTDSLHNSSLKYGSPRELVHPGSLLSARSALRRLGDDGSSAISFKDRVDFL